MSAPPSAMTARALLTVVREVANEIFHHIDNDRESKALRLANALAGRLPGYDVRTDSIAAAYAQPDSEAAEAREARLREALRAAMPSVLHDGWHNEFGINRGCLRCKIDGALNAAPAQREG